MDTKDRGSDNFTAATNELTLSRFRKKPVVVYAERFDGTDAILDFLGIGPAPLWGNDARFKPSTRQLFIHTLEGEMTANEGDWIVCGVKGEFYPIKPNIFAETYEQVAPGTGEPPCVCNVPDFIGYVGEPENWRCLTCGRHPNAIEQIHVKLFRRQAGTGEPPHRLQRIVNLVWQILTGTSEDIAISCGESRIKCDADRINYVVELLAAHVTAEGVSSHIPPGEPPHPLPIDRLREFFEAIEQQNGTNDHVWLVRHAKAFLAGILAPSARRRDRENE